MNLSESFHLLKCNFWHYLVHSLLRRRPWYRKIHNEDGGRHQNYEQKCSLSTFKQFIWYQWTCFTVGEENWSHPPKSYHNWERPIDYGCRSILSCSISFNLTLEQKAHYYQFALTFRFLNCREPYTRKYCSLVHSWYLHQRLSNQLPRWRSEWCWYRHSLPWRVF